jgi:hypothetical protein
MANELYPFSTPQGVPIPLDIVGAVRACRLINLGTIDLTSDSTRLFMAVAKGSDAYLLSSDTNITTASIPNASWVDKLTYLPEELPMMIAIPATDTKLKAFCGTSAYITLTELTKWAGVGLQKQITSKL